MIGVGINILKRKSIGIGAPYKADALVTITGAIKDVSGTYYFEDFSGNGRDFLITGYDFPTGWTSGFPYKSAATISAPAGDATLIAADVNNFLYAAGGTPNQIPIISLFQDIDYEHKLFCKHVAQILDSNGVETYEPRVTDIVLYSSVRAGSDLTTCQNYFDVPTEVATAKWVSKSGSDTTGTGTKAAPYLTIDKAYKTVAAGSTIYVKSGIYTEEYNSTSIRYLYLDSKNMTITGLGRVEMRTVSATFISRTASAIVTLNRLILNGEGSKTYGHYVLSGTNSTTYLNNCKIYNCTNAIATDASASYNWDILPDKCILSGNITTNDNPAIISNSYITTASINNAVTLSKNRIILTGIIALKQANISLFNNDIQINTILTIPIIFYNTITGTCEIKYNQITLNTSANTSGTTYLIYIDNNVVTPIIYKNKITSLRTTNYANQINLIHLIGTLAPEIEYNSITVKTKSVINCINLTESTIATGHAKINYNYIFSASTGGTYITTNSETGTLGKYDETEVIGNYIIGYLFDYPSETGTNHAILLNSGINFNVKYNRITYCHIGIVVKSDDIGTSVYSKNGISYNLFIHNEIDIWCRGVRGMLINNNSHYNNKATVINIDENGPSAGNQYSENILIKNAAIYADIDTFAAYVLLLDQHAGDNGCDMINCFVYNTNNNQTKLLRIGGTTYNTIAEAQAIGKFSGGLFQNPLFTSLANDNLILQSSSPAIGAGVNLGADYDDGLDASTDWGSDTEIPVVVTKQQGVAWDCGAYIS